MVNNVLITDQDQAATEWANYYLSVSVICICICEVVDKYRLGYHVHGGWVGGVEGCVGVCVGCVAGCTGLWLGESSLKGVDWWTVHNVWFKIVPRWDSPSEVRIFRCVTISSDCLVFESVVRSCATGGGFERGGRHGDQAIYNLVYEDEAQILCSLL